MTGPNERAAAFLALHQRGAGFILPNAWDPGSAVILERVGFAAIATTSAGIAWQTGRPDGALPRGEALEALAAIATAVTCPVTADLESGYGDTPSEVAATITDAVAAGAVGANLEDAQPGDGLIDLALAEDRIAAARAAAPRGTFVLNARTDPYMVRAEDAFGETVRRAERFVAAGADCIFVPGVSDAEEIRRLAEEIPAPLNVVAGLVEPVLGAATLRSLGVARISTGGTLSRAVLGLVERAGREMLENGTFSFADDAIAYSELQQRFSS
ncbi:MAG TPA: isocitrate lyase/phosphoenolpyruvate mutase family protein [Marmoricola sp.]|jgi:2-methylisocitrate lyase-like PEP mutase family enzyme|nr:isocitrate lyase/phosphoenolpyruvate mutase family protein [Marmoricola sp.]